MYPPTATSRTVTPLGRRLGGATLLLVASGIAAVVAACSSPATAPLPPPWPAAASTRLDIELRATAEALDLPPPPSAADAATAESIGGSPLVWALEGTSAGLTYIEVVLGDVDVDAPLPMVLMIHGRGDRPKVPGGPFACVATPVRIIMPRAPDPLASGFTWLSMRVAEGRTAELSDQLARRADQLAELLAEVSSKRPTLGRPVITGFSQGGLLTFALATRHPALVGAAVPLAGWLPPALWPASADGLPVIRSLHGVDDDTIPLAPTRAAVERLRELGADIDLLEYEGVGHRMSAAMNRQFERWLEAALHVEAPTLSQRPLDTATELGHADDAVECA